MMEPIVMARAPGHISLGSGHPTTNRYGSVNRQSIITVAVNYYAYAIISPSHTDGVHIIYAGHGAHPCLLEGDKAWEDELAVPKAVAHLFGIRDGMTIFLSAQAPLGVGLGLSGSLTASLIKALAFSCGLDLEPREVAELACHVRAETVRTEDDSLDQYTAICGGFNSIESAEKVVRIEPLNIPLGTLRSLERQIMLFLIKPSGQLPDTGEHRKTGRFRNSPAVRQGETSQTTSRRIRSSLEGGDLAMLWTLLDQSWLQQGHLYDGSERNLLVQSYKTARESGALCGRCIPANGGGSLVLFCPEEHQQSVTDSLALLGLQRWPIALAEDGVQVMEAVSRPKLASVREPVNLSSYLQHPR